MMRFSTEHLRKVFEDADKYENFKKLTYNLNHGIDIYEYDDDGNQRKVSKHEANKAIRKIIMEVCDLTEEDLRSNKRRERALELHHTEVYELLESDIDFKHSYIRFRNFAIQEFMVLLLSYLTTLSL